ncbi:hypothetical protein WJS89_04410 [Sphingomicrobium sp. XHP0235]|uniref:hypothetical protein n=1 Tax=Sphingomicrobium aquimarinum TaxID=3133971 RepID=UPI0031FF126F
MHRYLASFSVLALASCAAIKPAQMHLPADWTAISTTRFTGFNGWNTGKFGASDYYGTFQRSEGRLAYFDTLVQRSGSARFTVAGPEISSTIEARCRMRERALDLGRGIEVTTKPMAFRCDFTADGIPISARFELQEAIGAGTAAYRYERFGEIALGGEIVQIRSNHDIEGTSIGTITPIGYIFEQNSRVIGALNLNGSRELIIPEETDPGLARTLTVAALALSVFQDPASRTYVE